MCYAKPGPRCSNHARKKWDKLLIENNRLKEEYVKICDDRRDDPNITIADEKEAYRRMLTARRAAKAAEQAYYSTPEGFKMLEEKLATISPNSVQYDNASRKLEIGRRMRERQFALYHAEKHKGEIPHQYVADEENIEELSQNLRVGYGEGNVYVGRANMKPTKLDERQERKYAVLQKRVDKLVDCFRDGNGDFRINGEIVEAYANQDLTPGYKYLNQGSYKAAFLDEKTGYVIKLPVEYSTRVEDRDEDYMMLPLDEEQSSYAVIDVEDLNKLNGEYVETLFYTDSRNSDVNAVVQPYLDDKEYMNLHEMDDDSSYSFQRRALNMRGVEGLWDIRPDNYKIHRETERIVLFDCLNPNEY